MIRHRTVIKCPSCGYFQMETMPDGEPVVQWKCPNCGKIAEPRDGDDCVYCSYGSVRCPTAQREKAFAEPISRKGTNGSGCGS